MRDATRGGLATVCNELAAQCGLGVVLDEALLPVAPAVAGACDLLGIDPVHVANEGVFAAIVAAEQAEAAVVALREQPGGVQAAVVGEVVADPGGIVAMRTGFGGTRIVDMLVGDPLPRIC
jgi:hydrogenase expression/formation protein HypE